MKKSTPQPLLGLKIFWYEFTYIIKVWVTYFRFKYIHFKKEPKGQCH